MSLIKANQYPHKKKLPYVLYLNCFRALFSFSSVPDSHSQNDHTPGMYFKIFSINIIEKIETVLLWQMLSLHRLCQEPQQYIEITRILKIVTT